MIIQIKLYNPGAKMVQGFMIDPEFIGGLNGGYWSSTLPLFSVFYRYTNHMLISYYANTTNIFPRAAIVTTKLNSLQYIFTFRIKHKAK